MMRRLTLIIVASLVTNGCGDDRVVTSEATASTTASSAPPPAPRPTLDLNRDPKTYRGIPWGATRKQAHAITPLDEQCLKTRLYGVPELDRTRLCDPRTGVDLGDFKPNETLRFEDDRFVQATFIYQTSQYELMKAVLVEKYGSPPEITSVEMQAESGATYMNEIAAWDFPSARIECRRYGDRPTVGHTYLIAQSWLVERRAAAEATKRKAAGAF
jgi:hypothetical protein